MRPHAKLWYSEQRHEVNQSDTSRSKPGFSDGVDSIKVEEGSHGPVQGIQDELRSRWIQKPILAKQARVDELA